MPRKSLLGLVLSLAFALRLYHIHSPLWLDEIYGYRLARLGFWEILNNSWTDPHPPLYYLIQWVLSGSGQVKSELGWRILPVVCGVLTILAIWLAARKTANDLGSILCCLAAVASPSLIFYSQEARPYALTIFAASISTWLTTTILEEPAKAGRWIAWAIANLFGLYLGYSYLMLAATQMAYLGLWNYRRVIYWASCSSIILGAALLIPFAGSSLLNTLGKHGESASLTLWRTLQTLFAGEPLRYGFNPAHSVLPIAVIGLSILAVLRELRLRDRKLTYIIAQVSFPLVLFFLVSPFLQIKLPLPEARQFLVLLPAFYILIGNGLSELHQRFFHSTRWGAAATIGLCAAILSLSWLSLQAYWAIPKSPEGLAVLDLRENLQPGDRIVSLHHSTDLAIGFYITNARVYLNPKPVSPNSGTFRYQMVDADRLFEQTLTERHNKSVEQIRAHRRFWLLAHVSLYRKAAAPLLENCQIVTKKMHASYHGAFETMLVECPAP